MRRNAARCATATENAKTLTQPAAASATAQIAHHTVDRSSHARTNAYVAAVTSSTANV